MLSSRVLSSLQSTSVFSHHATLFTSALSAAPLKKRIAFLEVEGGSDKGPDGMRPDTMPLVKAVKENKGWSADVLWYEDAKRDSLAKDIKAKYDCLVPRINPGNVGEKYYFKMLNDIAKKIPVYEEPRVLTTLDSKDSLVMLNDTKLVPTDTVPYKTIKEMTEQFPKMLAKGERVLKQNRGSTGEGVWRVVVTSDVPKGKPIPLDAQLRCTEAVSNSVSKFTMKEFIEFCRQYIEKTNGGLVDMKFLHRIKEGEIRVVLVAEKPVFVVTKTPADSKDAFSATLFSGAKYVYESPDKWPQMTSMLRDSMEVMRKRFQMKHVPLLWSVDFIRDTDKNGNDTYVLSEFNCSCIGFTSHLDVGIQQQVAKELISRVTN